MKKIDYSRKNTTLPSSKGKVAGRPMTGQVGQVQPSLIQQHSTEQEERREKTKTIDVIFAGGSH